MAYNNNYPDFDQEDLDYWILQEHKIWKGIDPINPTWASLGFISSDWQNMQDLLELLEQNKPQAKLRVTKQVVL